MAGNGQLMLIRTKCFKCNHGTLVPQTVDLIGHRNGEEFTVRVPGLNCADCGFKTINNEQSGEFTKAVSDAYRNAHGLLTGTAIKDRRTSLEMSQLAFARHLGVGVASVKRWELGLIQEKAMDELIRLKTDLSTARRQLLDSWKDYEYRSAFVCERVRSSVALQIRALREQRNKMTQARLGDAIGMAQTWISRLEDPEYGKMTVATLLRLANAFDADLEIKFRPFSRALDELSKQGQGYFNVPSFAEELPHLEIMVK